MAKPIYANEFRVQVHKGRSRQRAWSESTCTSLLSHSESEDSLRIGSSVGAMASRPLPEIPLERSLVTPKEYQNGIRRVSFHRQEKKKDKKKSAAGSRRRTLIFISIASIVFSVFCLGLLVATFIRHGILPWDNVLLQSSSKYSCLSCIELLQSILLSKTTMKAECSSNISQASSSTVNHAHSLCLPVEVEKLQCLLKVVGKENFTAPLDGWYFIAIESQTTVAIDIKKQSSESTTQIASTQCTPCQRSKSDNSFLFCWADVIRLQEGDVISTNPAITIHNNDNYHLHIIVLHEFEK